MKTTLNMAAMAAALLASAPAMAFNDGTNDFWKYIWTGGANDGEYTSNNNWSLVYDEGQEEASANNSYHPGGNDWAYIGYDYSGDGTTSTFTPNNNTLTVTHTGMPQTSHIYLGSGTTLTCSADWEGIQTDYFYLSGGSNLIFTSTGDIGAGDGFTVDFGTFTADSHGTLTATGITYWWGDDKTITLTGTFDTTGLENGDKGSFTLASFAPSYNGINYDTTTIQIDFATLPATASVDMVQNSTGGYDLVVSYNIPEPTTATLSLLALAGLAARRRRE